MSLAEQQAEVMAALLRRGPIPPGFDAQRMHAAASVLASKRAKGVARAWPSLEHMLGAEWPMFFQRYGQHVHAPAQGGALADGRAFVRWLSGQRALSDDVRLQVLRVDIRYRQSAKGWGARRLPCLKFAWLAQRGSLAVALRLFGHRLWVF